MAKTSKMLERVIVYIGAVAVFLFMIFPIYSIFLQSIQYEKDVRTKDMNFIPEYITLDHFSTILQPGHIVAIREALFNSIFMSTMTGVLALTIGLLAAYAVARLKIRFGSPLLFGMASIYIFPTILFVIPLFILFVNAGLNDTYISLLLLYTAFVLPFVIWALKTFVDAIPIDIDHAARIDGCGLFKIFFHIYLPIMKPGIVAAFLFAFILSWIEFLTPLVFTSNIKMLTVELGLYRSTVDIDLGQLAAAAIVTMLPVVILTLVFQRLIIQVVTGEEK